ncbi:MAG: uracil-DNA glycosylase [Candidatus Omnitrophica bacterium]|nr:uracil-DNA glycosylase [Candidatus Omnitrophota bacterium]
MTFREMFAVSIDAASAASEGIGHEDKLKELEKVRQEAKDCKECELFKTRRNTVLGEGNPNAVLMFIGEAPGMEEDIQARPFVGKAGQLLTKIIEAIGLKREDVYIANSLKCRPPQNRTPFSSETIACRNYLTRQIDIIKPKIICCLGRPATQALLMMEMSITRARGKFYNYNNIKVMPTFHPAYLLRNPQDKRLVWEDMQKIQKELKEIQ